MVANWRIDATISAMDEQPVTHLRDLRRAGMSYREAHTSVAGQVRLAPAAYGHVDGRTPEERHLLQAMAVLDRVVQAVASHATAAAAWKLPLRAMDLKQVHLSPMAGRPGKPKRGPAHVMHAAPVELTDVHQVSGISATSPMRTVLDCARSMSGDWGVVVADAAIHARLVPMGELTRAATAMRHLHGSARARALAGLISPFAESPAETLTRLRLGRVGIQPREQVVLDDVEGAPRVDFLIDDCLVVEFDGQTKYTIDGDPALAHWREKQRHDRIVEAGYEVLHLTWSDLWDEAALRARVWAALRRARSRAAASPGA